MVRPEAEADIAAAAVWYEGEGDGLGAELVRAVAVCLSAIRRWPEAHRVAFPALDPPVRRALVRRFPYSVYYVATTTGVSVLACLHQHRDPEAILRAVEGRAPDV